MTTIHSGHVLVVNTRRDHPGGMVVDGGTVYVMSGGVVFRPTIGNSGANGPDLSGGSGDSDPPGGPTGDPAGNPSGVPGPPEESPSTGSLFVFSGGVVIGPKVFAGSIDTIRAGHPTLLGVTVKSGGKAFNTRLFEDGTLTVANGGVVSGTLLHPGSLEVVSRGGTDFNAKLLSDSNQFVRPGAAAFGTVISGGTQHVQKDALASGTIITHSGAEYTGYHAVQGGIDIDLVVHWGSHFILYGGTAFNTTVMSHGLESVRVGGVASHTVISGGFERVGGTIIDATVRDGGIMTTIAPGHTTKFGVFNSTGGLAIGTTVDSGGTFRVVTSAVDTMVNSGGKVIVEGTASDTKIAGGTVEFASGGATGDLPTTFTGLSGLVVLDDSKTFHGEIAGYGIPRGLSLPDLTALAQQYVASDQPYGILLADMPFTTAATVGFEQTGAGGMLTVSSGAQSANIALLGQYMAADFGLAPYAGGTLVTIPTSSTIEPLLALPPAVR